MIDYLPYHPQHASLVAAQPGQESEREFLLSPWAWAALSGSMAFSGFVGGVCIGCAGLVPWQDDKVLVWALLSKDAGRYMLPITRKVQRVLDAYPAKVAEATCDPGYPARRRWMEALGFEYTGEQRKPHPDYPMADVYRRDKTCRA